MAGSESRERSGRLAVQAGRDAAQIQPGDADTTTGGVRVQPEAVVVGIERAGHVTPSTTSYDRFQPLAESSWAEVTHGA